MKERLNKKELINWIVLDRQDNRILLISEKALDCKPYNTEESVWCGEQ